MYLNNTIKNILLKKLNFSNSTITAIEKDFELSAKVVGMMEILKWSGPTGRIKSEILKQLQQMERSARYSAGQNTKVKVEQAYLDHYSFK